MTLATISTVKCRARPSASASCLDCADWTRLLTFGTRACIAGSRKPPTLWTKSKNWRNHMILLRPDCLVFRTAVGENIPCSVQQVTVELLNGSGQVLEEEFIRNAAEAVLHYFKHDLGWTTVSVGEFTLALERALRGLGYDVQWVKPEEASPPVAEADLRQLACAAGKGFELFFFPRLRDELRLKLDQSPRTLRFQGLRGCVKQLMGAKRWSPRCQRLN